MLVNAAVAVLVVLLIGIGTWVTDRLARQSKLEDCMMAHRRNCRGVEVPDPGR
ncbi:MAG TPA: hypothetical protein VD978_05505 [Azospirillum sp.]|nr:hypothetical protein [Azospirillum sp.]